MKKVIASITLLALISALTASAADSGTKGWKNLTQEEPDAVRGSEYFIKWMKNTEAKQIAGETVPADEFIFAHATGRIEYRFRQPITQFRCKIALLDENNGKTNDVGEVIFVVESDDGEVFRSEPVLPGSVQEIDLTFEASKHLILITDDGGVAFSDWSVWLHPEVQ